MAIADADASLTDLNVPNVLSSLTVTITNLQDGIDEVHSELSYLGESLTDRFDLEDQLIEYVHKSNGTPVQ